MPSVELCAPRKHLWRNVCIVLLLSASAPHSYGQEAIATGDNTPALDSRPEYSRVSMSAEQPDTSEGIFNPNSTDHPVVPVRFRQEKLFILLGTQTYLWATLDMHATSDRGTTFNAERDPLAKPFMLLPTPAYYAAGVGLVSGANWLSWKMAHSQKWRKLWWLPQVVSVGGSLTGWTTSKGWCGTPNRGKLVHLLRPGVPDQ